MAKGESQQRSKPRSGKTRPAARQSGRTTDSTAPQASESQSIEEAIGAQVRELRKLQDMTVAELASQAGLSAGMLSKVENGGISPSLATLQSLAQALNVPMTTFFSAFEEKRDAYHVRADEGLSIERRGTKVGHQYQLLGSSLGGDVACEPYLVTITEDAEAYPSFRHEGQEFIYLLEGEVGYRHGEKIYSLTPGDSLFFDARAPHGPEELRRLPLRFLSIIVFSRE
ncbi:helix-turn-helix domain-containing protein [Pelagibius sp. CAU 1746]|uniref:helix-turn-helix domain-containing protein n=1 Tax=Pelagibius sp. CAU 1746 TaxID=3140370 RepID=UPI00325B3E08